MATAASAPIFSFKKPVQSRAPNASGVMQPVYTFSVTKAEGLTGEYEYKTVPLKHLTDTLFVEHPNWLLGFVEAFLQETRSYFAKPYSSTVVLKHLDHKVTLDSSCTEEDESVVTRTYIPTAVVVAQGRFHLEWTVHQETIAIQIPDEDENEEVMLTVTQRDLLGLTPTVHPPAPPRSSNEIITDVDTNSLPFDPSSDVLDLRTNDQQSLYKRKVKEAHLRAKLAQYKAERALAKYIDKYGDALSDTSGDSGWETSDADSDSE